MAITRVLKKGSSGVDVQELQNMLLLANISIGPSGADGQFGSDTEAAVKGFQAVMGLPIDGIAGSVTVNALMAYLEGKGVTPASTPAIPQIPGTAVPPLPKAGGIDWTMIGIIAAVVIAVVLFTGKEEN
jgi:peptidoglycan hydrolase-like protein with peptidoglycan-binding domain